MQKAILTYFKIDSDVKTYNFQSGDGTYLTFSCSSIKPDKKGVYFKAYCQAFDGVIDRINRMKIKTGSVVDMVCEMTMYTKKVDGKDELKIGYKILDINFSEFYETKPEAEKKPENNTNTNNLNAFYNMTQKDPFAIGS